MARLILILVLVPVLAVVGWVGWLAYTFAFGAPASRAAIARAQTDVDVVFPDYPVRVAKLRHFSFIKEWDEVTLVPVQDPHVELEISPWLGESSLRNARADLKILRDGQVGTPPRRLNPTPRPTTGNGYWNVAGAGPEVSFGDRDPYDWERSRLTLTIYSEAPDLSASDAALVTSGLAAVGDRRDRLAPIRIYHPVRVTGVPGYFYEVTVDAAGAATLAEDFERVRAGGAVPGITRVRR